MPQLGNGWTMADVDYVAVNLQYLTRSIYDIMSATVGPNHYNQEYAQRMPRVLAQLADAADNFAEAVDRSYDYTDTLDDLFYLESMVDLAEQTLDGFQYSYYSADEMAQLRYYVNELLWVYRQGY
jgi:hypothetical protein